MLYRTGTLKTISIKSSRPSQVYNVQLAITEICGWLDRSINSYLEQYAEINLNPRKLQFEIFLYLPTYVYFERFKKNW